MSTPELTPWFPADVKPARVGVYQVDPDCRDAWYSYFDGRRFGWQTIDPEGAYLLRAEETMLSGKQVWRGLAQDPKVKK